MRVKTTVAWQQGQQSSYVTVPDDSELIKKTVEVLRNMLDVAIIILIAVGDHYFSASVY